ncbi:MAG: glycosyltransferase family 2 protein [Lachnospiraceae bacterium]|uniref:Glycosyltransferase family 2 protein n=1 Tax=Candidatus Weimeria bifida TaxID=2599074 RepID=A0A6N7IXD9_9FIRM|nr:glycosyltransferase family 2 protein [Candidatus Weimeria bifida]RRF97158.1 MAG: glycosyltransferase family 2 protein [Lachnospiraceae bacterium]
MKKAAICICNYNKRDMIGACLQAVSEQKFSDFDVYVCDNHSTDDSVTVIEQFIKKHPEMNTRLLVTDENLGGAGGFDTALRAALDADEEYEYLMCVDNDCLLDENCVGELADHLDKNPSSGMAASKIYFLDNPDLIQCYGLDISYKLCGTVSRYFGKPEDGTSPEVVYSDAAPACALMIRTSLAEKIGLLPEENYIYWDDTTWCYRVRKAGYKVANVGAAMALHGLGQRAEVKNTFGTYYAWRNTIRYFLQTTPDDIFSEVAIKILTDVYLEACGDYESGRPERCAAVMAALDDAVHGVCGKAREGIIRDVSPSDQDISYETVDSLPEKYRAGAEIFLYTHYGLFLHGRSLQ